MPTISRQIIATPPCNFARRHIHLISADSITMAPSKTKTMKNKHAGSKSGIGKHASKKQPGPPDGIVKPKQSKGTPPAKAQLQTKVQKLLDKRKKLKNKKYTDEELGVPQLNMITPVGVEKPRGKKKGKVFVDDRVSHTPSPLNTSRSMSSVSNEAY